MSYDIHLDDKYGQLNLVEPAGVVPTGDQADSATGADR